MESVRTDRLGLLTEQFERSRELAQARLEGLGDDEYLWEPAPGAWSIRRRDQAPTPRAFGLGERVLDRGAPGPEELDPWDLSEAVKARLDHPGAGHHHRLAAGPPAFQLRGALGVDLR